MYFVKREFLTRHKRQYDHKRWRAKKKKKRKTKIYENIFPSNYLCCQNNQKIIWKAISTKKKKIIPAKKYIIPIPSPALQTQTRIQNTYTTHIQTANT